MLCNKSWRDFLNTDGSMPHNPRIADVFYRRGLMETWGRGIELIMDGCKAAGLPEPTFEVNPPFVNLIIRFKESLGGLNGTITQKSGMINGAINGTLEQGDGGLNGGLNLSALDKAIIKYIKDNPNSTVDEISRTLGKAKRTTERAMSTLRGNGVIDKEGSKKSGKWVILIPDK